MPIHTKEEVEEYGRVMGFEEGRLYGKETIGGGMGLAKAKSGKLHFEFEHKGIEPLLNNLDVVSNRLSFAVIVGSLIVGSSLITLSGIPPLYKGIPIIGIIGFVISGLLALGPLIAMLKRGKF